MHFGTSVQQFSHTNARKPDPDVAAACVRPIRRNTLAARRRRQRQQRCQKIADSNTHVAQAPNIIGESKIQMLGKADEAEIVWCGEPTAEMSPSTVNMHS